MSSQTPLYTSTHILSGASQLATATFTQSSSPSPSFSYSASPSFSYSPSISQSFSQRLSPSFTLSPSSTSSQVCRLTSAPTTALGSISDNTFYIIIFTIVGLFFINISYSIHYYNAYTNEKTRSQLISDRIQMNPYHTTVRDTFNRV